MMPRDEGILRKIISEIDFLNEALDGVEIESFREDETLKRASNTASIR